MKTLRFTSNINCNNCIAKVTPHLDSVPSIVHWEVDIGKAEKILTVYGEGTSSDAVREAVQKAGYRITLLEERES